MDNLEIHVEVCQKIDSSLSQAEVETCILNELRILENVPLEVPISGSSLIEASARTHIDSITCFCNNSEKSHVKVQDEHHSLNFHIYRLTAESAAIETMQNDSEDLSAYAHWILPCREFYTLWENLHFEFSLKQDLLNFVETTILFSEHDINPNIISCNKVVFLYGPPGTGKTSMCKALAQKLSIRLNSKFTHGELIEINSNSLFSKWFSESGKLVMKLFDEIRNLLENTEALFCILINEIESLAHVRKSSSTSGEPSDAIRVVNALLTQLDQIKHYPNVIILTTSNLMDAVDLAFVDRADIKHYIGLPTYEAIYKIYCSCLRELMRTKLMESEEILELSLLKNIDYMESPKTENSIKLMELSKISVGLSGRALRKIPFVAHAKYLPLKKFTLAQFLRAMNLAVQSQKEEPM